MINRLEKNDLNCSVFNSYDFDDCLSLNELLCRFFTKINECIEASNKALTLMEWLKEVGLKQEVVTLLTQWKDDGTLAEIIGEILLKEINTKINKNITDIKILKTNLENSYVNINDFHTIGEVDDTLSFTRAIEYCITNSYKNILLPRGRDYTITNITLKKGVSLIGNDINLNYETMTLEGDNEITGINFNGNLHCDSINLIGDNIRIYDNIFKNIKAKGAYGSYCLKIGDNEKILSNIIIEKNNFDNIEPYSLDGIIGNTLGSCRFILIGKVNNCIIRDNIFENMINLEDGDMIHVQTVNTCNNTFPYTEEVPKYDYSNCVIEGNTFNLLDTKSAIKVQASGVLIKNNYVNVNNNNKGYSVFRVQSCENVQIKNNVITVEKNNIEYIIAVNNSSYTLVSENVINYSKVKSVKSIVFSSNTTNGTIIVKNNINAYNVISVVSDILNTNLNFSDNNICIDSIEDIKLIYSLNQNINLINDVIYSSSYTNNIINMFSKNIKNIILESFYGGSFTLDNLTICPLKEVTLKLNLKCYNSENGETYININNLSGYDKVELYITKSSKVTPSYSINEVLINNLDNISNTNINDVKKLSIKNSHFLISETLDLVNIRDVNILEVINNIIEGSKRAFIKVNTGNCLISCINNYFKTNINELINSYGNDLYVKGSEFYIKGSNVKGYDYGYTNQRPTCKLSPYHSYYDTTLNKLVFHNSESWTE